MRSSSLDATLLSRKPFELMHLTMTSVEYWAPESLSIIRKSYPIGSSIDTSNTIGTYTIFRKL